ncbi:hypothetical protein H4582DRAFT_2054570 [Lactarius indigo]|nr:hypothetical protein H4582DRAFT_2054570 [Lactarius indigo]
MFVGVALLMQPALSSSSAFAAAATAVSTSVRPRRGGVVSYADPGSGDDIPDAGEVDSDGSDFVARGGTRTVIRAVGLPQFPRPRPRHGWSWTRAIRVPPPARFIIAKPFVPTKHVDFSEEKPAVQAQQSVAFVSIRIQFEINYGICANRSSHQSNLRELSAPSLIHCWHRGRTVAAQICAKLEDQDSLSSMELAVGGGKVPESRFNLSFRPGRIPTLVRCLHSPASERPADKASGERRGAKDKTGLGLWWGRMPKESWGPRILRSVWRDWAEAEEFKRLWGMLSQEEVERLEIERERTSRQNGRGTLTFNSDGFSSADFDMLPCHNTYTRRSITSARSISSEARELFVWIVWTPALRIGRPRLSAGTGQISNPDKWGGLK